MQMESQARNMLTLKDAQPVSEGRCASWYAYVLRSGLGDESH